jgi:DNA-binding GntR family transcriptional regulator
MSCALQVEGERLGGGDITDNYGQTRMIRRIEVASAPQVAAQAIRDAIITAKFKAGERLVEGKLAEDLGIGQPTLREALKELEYEGLVRKIPQRGTYIAKPSKNELEKMLAVRMQLESLAINLAARKMTSQVEDELTGIVNEMASAARSMDLARFNDSDVAFHRVIWALAANEYLAKALHLVTFQLFVFGVTGEQSQNEVKFLASVDQHNNILNALRSRDPIIAGRTFVKETLSFWQLHYGISTSEMLTDHCDVVCFENHSPDSGIPESVTNT